MEIFVPAITKAIGMLALFGIFALLVRIFSAMLPKKYRDGKIAPEIIERPEPGYVADLNKEMEEAGVDNLRDLEEYRENKQLNRP